MPRAYLDHNATTPVDPAVLAAMLPYFSAEYGNANSIHSWGQHAHGAVEQARESVAALIGARPNEIIFTSGGTEGDNAAIFGVVHFADGEAAGRRAQRHVITSNIEHYAVGHACQALERRGIAVTYVKANRDGVVAAEEVRSALRPETVLITVMHANNELGTLQPVEEIARVARDAGVRFHTDAVQSAGKVPLDVNTLGVDLLSLSAHKLYGPKGVGALFVRKGVKLEPLIYGGHAERGRRAGTLNVPGIVGLGKAAEIARDYLTGGDAQTRGLRDHLERGLLERVAESHVNGGAAPRLPNTCNMMFTSADSESLVIALDLLGVACSAGAACASGAVDPSHVLTSIGLSSDEARASVRLSLGRLSSADDVALALEVIPLAVARQREFAQKSSTSSQERVPAK